ncbi:serine decarboxylase-like [Cajanus cajan]|uniref:serine decarboxylase-like n=1 Tax=Cajanus cajan TaxID=3821 RepID=UPI00098DBAD6|nr:serine decarboxylase-like [Cajanus cajan]
MVDETSSDKKELDNMTKTMLERSIAVKKLVEAKEATNFSTMYDILMKDTSGMTEKQLKDHELAYLSAGNIIYINTCTGQESSAMKKKETQIDNIEENDGNCNTNLAITKCTGETQANLASLITQYVESLNQRRFRHLGYPTNQDLNYDVLLPLLNFHLNNAGDPFLGSSFSLNSTAFEVCVLDWFANLWEIEKNEYWGYVTTGGTEGNLHGILVGLVT